MAYGCGGGGGGGDPGGGGGGGGTPSFTVSTSAGTGGSISPASASVTQGATAAFTVTPLASHDLVGVTGCGGTLSGNTYTTGAITAACTVTATFALKSYTVTASAGPGGSIAPASATVDHGETAQFTVGADAGFNIAGVTGCGGTLSGTTYTTGAITADCAVEASFAAGATAPTGVSASAGDGQVTVSWSPVDGATAYNLYWSSTPGIHPGTAASYDEFVAGVASPHTVTGLGNDDTYYFVVTAMFDGVESPPSNEVSARPTTVAGSGLIRTTTHLIDVDAARARLLHMPAPLAFAFLGDEIFAMPSTLVSGSPPRPLWRYVPATGELEQVMEVGPRPSQNHQLLRASPDGELIAFNGSTTFVAIDPEARTFREFSNPEVDTGTRADFTVAGNGNILARSTSAVVVVMDKDGHTLATSDVGSNVLALASTPDGRVVGIRGSVTQGVTQTTIVEIDPATGAVTVLGSGPDVWASGSTPARVRLAASSDGYLVSESRRSASDLGSIYFVNRSSFEVTALALPDGVEIQDNTTLEVGPDGHLYARVGDRRTPASTALSVVMRFSLAGDEPEIALAGGNVHGRYSAVGPGGDLFHYASGTLSTGHILRENLRTSGLTHIAHDAALVNGYDLTVDDDSVYVISFRPDGEHLVHVDIPSGAVTELSALGQPPTGEDRWFVNALAPDPLSDDLILGSSGGLASVARLATTPGGVPQIIASQFSGGAPLDLKTRPNGDILFLNSAGIYLVNPFTGAHSLVVAVPAEVQNARAFVELDDGRFVLFDLGGGDGQTVWDQTLWRVDPATGQAEDFLVDPPSAHPSSLSFGWPYLFRVP